MSFSLDEYKRVSKIGSGAFGDVFKIKKKDTGEIFAAKISRNTIDLKKHDETKNLEREVENISKISHPSILGFIGFSPTDFKNNKKPVIVTEYLPNGSLEDIIRLERLSEPDPNWTDTRKLISLYGIAAAMAFLHFHDILHRDLKPENILLDDRLFPKIADFGLSKDESTYSSTVEIKGTPIYIAPEIWEDGQYSKASDVYAYGFLAYEIITGERPFTDLNIYKLQNKVCKGDRPEIKDAPPVYQQLIESCWAKDLSDRPSFDEIRTQLKRNADFITDKIDEEDYKCYVRTIDRSRKIFDSKKPSVIELTFERETATFRSVQLHKKRLLSMSKYNKLNKSSQHIVDEAIDNPDKQFEVGRNLIEGSNDFPKDIDTGILYLKSSIEGLNIDAAVYYNRMLINGKIIPKNLDEAKSNLKKYEIQNEPEIKSLLGIIERKQENYEEAIDIFYDICSESAEASYQLGKMTYRGEGTDQNTKLAKEYFDMAIGLGCTKVDNFYSKKKNKKAKSRDNSKRVDIVFLLDGCQPMFPIYSAFIAVVLPIIEKCHKNYPNILFRFGSVIYKIKPITDRMPKTTAPIYHNKLVFNDLTNDLDEIQNFFMKNKVFGAGAKWAVDWASGYECLGKKIHWNKKAQKIVIQISNLPALGKMFTLDSRLPNDLIAIPNFKNVEETNESIFDQIQTEETTRFKKQITKVANLELMFFCLNCNQLSLCSFKKVCELYTKKNGKKYVIKDLFLDQLKMNPKELQKQIKQFIWNSVQCSINSKNGDDDDENVFESQCETQFNKDFDKFIDSNKSSTNQTSTPQPKKIVKRTDHKKRHVSDNEDDDDDDDDGFKIVINKPGKNINNVKNKQTKLKKKTASTPSIPHIRQSMNEEEEDDDDDFDDRSKHRKQPYKKKTKNVFDFE